MAGADGGGVGGGGRSLGGGGPGDGGGVRTPPTTPKKVGGKMLAVKILMLDDTYTLFQIQSKACASVLLEQVCRQLNLLESDYFGLEYTDGNTRYWLDLEKPMCRQVCLSQVEPVLRFCVKFYTPDPAQLEEEYTRYLFALQIKRDLAHGCLLCNDNTAALMASYIVQAECGDFVEEDYPDHRYLSLYKFVPSQDPELERKIMENHKKHVGMTPAAADLNLLETARRCELYGIKMHPAKDNEGVPLNLAVAHMGVLVFQNYTKINTFSWAKIRKLSFKRKRFLTKLHPEGYGYYKDIVEFFFDGRNECKNFWKKCVEHHGFFRCSQVKKVPRHKTRVLSRGSSFRYSGRTQKQVQEFVRDNYVKRAPFQRSQSFRHSPSVHASVSSVGMSISAQPLLPLSDNQCIGTPVSLSCGSMTLASTGDPQSPGSPTQTETADLHDFDTRDLETPSVTPSRQDTLSPETSVTSSPQRGHDPEYPHHPGQHRHYPRAPSLDTNSTMSSRQQLNSNPPLLEGSLKDFSFVDNRHFTENADDSGDNLSHESYELIEREGGKWEESRSSSRVGSRSGSKLMLNSGEIGSMEGMEWAELKGEAGMGRGRTSSYTGSLPRSHGSTSSVGKKQTNGYTGSLPRTHSSSQFGSLSRSLAGSRASSRITLELPLDSRPPPADDEDLASPGSPEFHENSVCEITSEKGYILTTRHLGTITINDGSSVFSQLSLSHHSGVDLQESISESVSSIRSRASSHSRLGRESCESLRDATEPATHSTLTQSTRLSASMRAAKEMGQYVDYGSSQESLHKMSSCESDGGSSLSSHTRSSTTPRPMDLQHGFLQHRRSTSTSPPSVTSYSSQQSRPRCIDFSTLHKKSKFPMYGAGRGSDSGGNTDSDICSPLEILHPIAPPPEQVREEDEDDDDLTPSQEQVQFLPRPPDMDLITRIRGSSDEEEEEQEEFQFELESEQEDQIVVVIEEKVEPHVFDFEILPPPPEVKEESPSSGEMDLTDVSREKKIDESDASERTVIERFRLPDDRLSKLGSKDSQMSIEEIDESILDRRSSVTGERRQSVHDVGRKSPYPASDRRPSYQDGSCISPSAMSDRERRSSLHEAEKSPFLEKDRRSSLHSDLGRRSPYDREKEERKSSSSSERRSSVCSDRRSSASSDRRGSASSERRPSLSDIGRRASISIEPGQRSPFFDAPVFEFEPGKEAEELANLPVLPPPERSPKLLDAELKSKFFDGILLEEPLIGMDELTEALIPPEEAPQAFASLSGARVTEIMEGGSGDRERSRERDRDRDRKVIVTVDENDEDDGEVFLVEPIRTRKDHGPKPKPPPKPVVKPPPKPPPKPIEKEPPPKVEVALEPKEVEAVVEKELPTQPPPRPPDMEMEEEEPIGAVGGPPPEEELDRDYYGEEEEEEEEEEEDDHAQMSDQSPQSPDLVSEPDEYHDDYQEPEYYQITRQIDMGYAFPSRTLSRISERSTTSEQEHEQDHIGLPEPEPEHTDSKISTPTEEKLPSIPSEEQQGELPSDYSNSTSDDNQSDNNRRPSLPTAPEATDQAPNHHSFTTAPPAAASAAAQFFLRDLPEFVPGDDSDEFPSPPSSAFLENPHTELSHIETYYMEINQRVNQTSEGIYDNIPVKFEGIHEVSESESASEENHTLQEPEDNIEMLEEAHSVEELEEEEEGPPPPHGTPRAKEKSPASHTPSTSTASTTTTSTKPRTPTRLRREPSSPSPPPPPPPPRPFMRPPSLSRSPSPPITPPTPVAREMPITKYDSGQRGIDVRHRMAVEYEVRGSHLHESRENLSTAGLTAAQSDSGEWNSF